jgi:hypothetical protein
MPALIPLLSSGRAAVGVAAWVAPRLSGRILGLDGPSAGQARLVVRLFAVRDLALAAGLQLSRGEDRRLWLQLGIACDAADGLAGILAGAQRRSMLGLTGPALVGVGLGVAALQAGDRET